MEEKGNDTKVASGGKDARVVIPLGWHFDRSAESHCWHDTYRH